MCPCCASNVGAWVKAVPVQWASRSSIPIAGDGCTSSKRGVVVAASCDGGDERRRDVRRMALVDNSK